MTSIFHVGDANCSNHSFKPNFNYVFIDQSFESAQNILIINCKVSALLADQPTWSATRIESVSNLHHRTQVVHSCDRQNVLNKGAVEICSFADREINGAPSNEKGVANCVSLVNTSADGRVYTESVLIFRRL